MYLSRKGCSGEVDLLQGGRDPGVAGLGLPGHPVEDRVLLSLVGACGRDDVGGDGESGPVVPVDVEGPDARGVDLDGLSAKVVLHVVRREGGERPRRRLLGVLYDNPRYHPRGRLEAPAEADLELLALDERLGDGAALEDGGLGGHGREDVGDHFLECRLAALECGLELFDALLKKLGVDGA